MSPIAEAPDIEGISEGADDFLFLPRGIVHKELPVGHIDCSDTVPTFLPTVRSLTKGGTKVKRGIKYNRDDTHEIGLV